MRKLLSIFVLVVVSVSCEKNDSIPIRKVSYSVTGNYGGKLNIIYINTRGQSDTAKSVSTPWTTEIIVADSVRTVSLIASTDTTKMPGTSGQKVFAILKTGGVQRMQDTLTAPASGRIQSRILSHNF
jgi:Mycobacterium membrane protein